MLRIDVITLFTDMFESPLSFSILKRARESGLVEIALSNIRDFAIGSYRQVDDKPYGGGPGMVMMCKPVFDCYEHVLAQSSQKPRTLLMTPPEKPVVVVFPGVMPMRLVPNWVNSANT